MQHYAASAQSIEYSTCTIRPKINVILHSNLSFFQFLTIKDTTGPFRNKSMVKKGHLFPNGPFGIKIPFFISHDLEVIATCLFLRWKEHAKFSLPTYFQFNLTSLRYLKRKSPFKNTCMVKKGHLFLDGLLIFFSRTIKN